MNGRADPVAPQHLELGLGHLGEDRSRELRFVSEPVGELDETAAVYREAPLAGRPAVERPHPLTADAPADVDDDGGHDRSTP